MLTLSKDNSTSGEIPALLIVFILDFYLVVELAYILNNEFGVEMKS